jgi:hypothetical protein
MSAGTPPRAPQSSPEILEQARRLYETTELSQAEIARRLSLTAPSLRRIAKREEWRRPAAAAERRVLVRNVREKIDREIGAVERVLSADGGSAAPGTERAARTLASLVRTLRELARYDEEQARAARPEVEDDAVADIDALREALARRLDRLREERGE